MKRWKVFLLVLLLLVPFGLPGSLTGSALKSIDCARKDGKTSKPRVNDRYACRVVYNDGGTAIANSCSVRKKRHKGMINSKICTGSCLASWMVCEVPSVYSKSKPSALPVPEIPPMRREVEAENVDPRQDIAANQRVASSSSMVGKMEKHLGEASNGSNRDYDAYTYAGKRFGKGKERGQYAGIAGEMRGMKMTWMGQEVQFGPYAAFDGFKGKTDDGYRYYGNSVEAGAAAKMLGKGWDATGRVGFGSTSMDGDIALYRNKQVNRFFSVQGGFNNHQRRDAKEKWFPEFSAESGLRLGLDASREDSWDGRTLNNPAESANRFVIGGKVNVVSIPFDKEGKWSFEPTAGAKGVYSRSEGSWTNSIIPGISLREEKAGEVANIELAFDNKSGVTPSAVWQIGASIEAWHRSRIGDPTERQVGSRSGEWPE